MRAPVALPVSVAPRAQFRWQVPQYELKLAHVLQEMDALSARTARMRERSGHAVAVAANVSSGT